MVNKSKIIEERNLNADYFEIEGNHELNKEGKSLHWVFYQIFDPWLTLRSQSTHIYAVHTFFGFSYIYGSSS